MRIDIITVLPEMIEGFINESILARAQKKASPRFTYITCEIILTINGDVWMTIPMEASREW